MPSPRDQALNVARLSATYASERLGPCSARLLQDAAPLALVASRMRAGAPLEDAVLRTVFDAAASDALLAGEFLAHFMPDLQGPGGAQVTPDLRRFVDGSDLVQSVVGDLWPDLCKLEFQSRDAYLAFLKQRVRWKASNRRRDLNAKRRSEDRRVSESVEELDPLQSGPSPATRVALDEESEDLVRAVLALSPRDRTVVRMYLRGEPAREIGKALGLREDAARKAVQRALAHLRTELAS